MAYDARIWYTAGLKVSLYTYDEEFRDNKYDAKNMKGVHPESFMSYRVVINETEIRIGVLQAVGPKAPDNELHQRDFGQ